MRSTLRKSVWRKGVKARGGRLCDSLSYCISELRLPGGIFFVIFLSQLFFPLLYNLIFTGCSCHVSFNCIRGRACTCVSIPLLKIGQWRRKKGGTKTRSSCFLNSFCQQQQGCDVIVSVNSLAYVCHSGRYHAATWDAPVRPAVLVGGRRRRRRELLQTGEQAVQQKTRRRPCR